MTLAVIPCGHDGPAKRNNKHTHTPCPTLKAGSVKKGDRVELSLDFLPTGEVLLDGADLTCTVAGRLVLKIFMMCYLVACVVVSGCMFSFRCPPTQHSRATNKAGIKSENQNTGAYSGTHSKKITTVLRPRVMF